VLVAGGAGYIGSHTCKALAQAGHVPIVYDNLRTGHAWAVKWGPLEEGDLNDAAALAGAMRRHRPEAVINFAALAYVGESMKEPTLYYRANVAGMITLRRQCALKASARLCFPARVLRAACHRDCRSSRP
jgi:UDP-arabinose 4-epimerase